MKRVTGIGGIFFQAQDPAALRAWYQRHLGLDVQPWGGAAFSWTDADGQPTAGTTIWSVAARDSEQFLPGKAAFMINYRVDDLDALLQALREEGCDGAGQGARFGIRPVRLGHRSRGQQGGAVAAATGAVSGGSRQARRHSAIIPAQITIPIYYARHYCWIPTLPKRGFS